MSVVRYEHSDVTYRQRHLTGCSGKAAMPRAVAVVAGKRLRARGFQINEYSCRHCGQWHVGGREKA